ncbi:MAG: O-antigen ligase family protein [Prosthecobacter sp.]|nr:O-antigen ligase family protein [Prosthecobacter sp.]
MIIFYGLKEDAHIGVPLKNWFIYGGWNTVCTGMTFGFAAVWAAWEWRESAKGSASWKKASWLIASVLLNIATLLTLSRGALLALTAAHLVWFLPQGWRAAWRPVILFAGCVAIFQLAAPVVSYLAAKEVAADLGVEAEVVHSRIQDFGVIPPNPALRLLERGDNGRFAIYAGALSSMTTWRDWLLGKGLWSANDAWSCGLWWNPEHLHSVYLDSLVRGGVLSLLGLLFLTGWGLVRAWRLAVEGEALWLVLAVFGLVGMVFDGDSLCTMLSVPRFEMLLFWTPLVIASARHGAAFANAPKALFGR